METTYLTVSLVLLSTFALQSISTARAQLTDMDRREVLDVHNHFRSIVAPTAANMVRLVRMHGFHAIACPMGNAIAWVYCKFMMQLRAV